MRLSAEQVKAALLHHDRDVRTAALRYFAESFSRDPGVMPLVIEAIERWGWKGAYEATFTLQNLVQVEESVRWLFDQTNANLPADPENELRYHNVVRSALIHADASLLERFEFEVLNLNGLDDEAKQQIASRISLRTSAPGELWQQLEDICYRADSAYEILDDTDFACDLVDALGGHYEFSVTRVLSVLSGETGDSGRWLEVFAVRLAGELRLQEAVPGIIAMLPEADDWIFEEAERALIKIGGDAVVEQLAHDYSAGDFGFRIVGAFILYNIHSDSSVATSLRLAESEEDQDVKNVLIQSALGSFSTEAIEPARQHVLSVPLDPEVIEVRNDLLAVCKLLGQSFPEVDAWTEAAKHDQESRRAWYESQPLHSIVRAMQDELSIEDDAPALPPTTITRDEARVGRNDPCPCGSGKKFKRCCLRDRRPVP